MLAGLTIKLPDPLIKLLGARVNELAADVRLTLAVEPKQIVGEDNATVIGSGATVMVIAEVEVPQAFCPVTTYELVEVGKKLAPLATALLQV